ncbi:hypothetical protein [Dyella sp.]|jgi:hypothetical protein|uniref:hypothetical protein n=1 Tax=Dyella sp. TaxID=1869338 RepID=UPI002D79C418|nr:hypothetical protein [Dyella sp.]HET6433113.1 hypothetical protein [Dyella sp.]
MSNADTSGRVGGRQPTQASDAPQGAAGQTHNPRNRGEPTQGPEGSEQAGLKGLKQGSDEKSTGKNSMAKDAVDTNADEAQSRWSGSSVRPAEPGLRDSPQSARRQDR